MHPLGQSKNLIGPIHLTAQGLLFHTIQIKPEIIVPGLGRNLPPEGDRGGATDHALHKGALAVADGSGLGRIDPIMGYYSLT